MFSYNSKLQDQIFNLKFAAKQFTKESQKAEKEEKAEKLKIKKAMEKGKPISGENLPDLTLHFPLFRLALFCREH